jgi:VanZ family protein
MKRFFAALLPFLTLLSVLYIFSNSLASEPEAYKKKSAVVKKVEEIVEVITKEEIDWDAKELPVVSKIAHVLEYSVFAFFFTATIGFYRGGKTAAYIERILFVGCMVALADEHLQSISDGRSSRVSDVMIDLAGILIGYWIAAFVIWLIGRRKKHA